MEVSEAVAQSLEGKHGSNPEVSNSVDPENLLPHHLCYR